MIAAREEIKMAGEQIARKQCGNPMRLIRRQVIRYRFILFLCFRLIQIGRACAITKNIDRPVCQSVKMEIINHRPLCVPIGSVSNAD